MSFPQITTVTIPNDGTNALVATGDEIAIDQLAPNSVGYDYIRDGAAAFTGVLEGSVSGLNWTTIVALAANAQGAVPPQYHYVRARNTVGGILGVTTRLRVAGVCQ